MVSKKIITHFQKVDPILYSLVVKYGIVSLVQSSDYFFDLVESIIGQQLSDSAASTIFRRFSLLFKNSRITPEAVIALSDGKIQSAGISRSKTSYIKNIALAVTTHTLNLRNLESFDNQRVQEELTKVKGIGPWTAEMFLLFSLARPDVFSYSDTGLRRAIQKAYRLKEVTPDRLEKISRRWIPFRSYACRVLWRSLRKED